jgi:hypothetical protein
MLTLRAALWAFNALCAFVPLGRFGHGPGQPLDPGYARSNGLTFSCPLATLVLPCTSRGNDAQCINQGFLLNVACYE